MVGLWGVGGNREALAARLRSAGADEVAGSLDEARDRVAALLRDSAPHSDTEAPAAAARRPAVTSVTSGASGDAVVA